MEAKQNGNEGKRQTYKAILDIGYKGRFWFSGMVRKLYPSEAQPLIDAGKIIPCTVEPKKFVEIHLPDGTIETLTWGQYLKMRKRKGGE